MTITLTQRAALKQLYERAGEHPTQAHVDASDIGNITLGSLIRHGFLTANPDGTVTLTERGLLVVLHFRGMGQVGH